MIERVEKLSSEYDRLPFRDVRGLDQGDVEVEISGTKNGPDPAVTVHRGRSVRASGNPVWCERLGTKSARVHVSWTTVLPESICDASRSRDRAVCGPRTHLRTGSIITSLIVHRAAILIGNRQRRAVLNRGDAGYVPAFGQQTKGARGIAEGQIVAVVDNEALWMAEANRTILLRQRGRQIAVRAAARQNALDIA